MHWKRLSLIKLHSNLIYLALLFGKTRQHAVPIFLSTLIPVFGFFLHIFNLIHFCAYENTRDWERSTILFPFFHLNSFQSHYKTTSSSLFHCCCARGKIAKGLWSRPKCTMFGTKGQLISKCLHGVIIWTKKPRKFFPGFLPLPLKREVKSKK